MLLSHVGIPFHSLPFRVFPKCWQLSQEQLHPTLAKPKKEQKQNNKGSYQTKTNISFKHAGLVRLGGKDTPACMVGCMHGLAALLFRKLYHWQLLCTHIATKPFPHFIASQLISAGVGILAGTQGCMKLHGGYWECCCATWMALKPTSAVLSLLPPTGKRTWTLPCSAGALGLLASHLTVSALPTCLLLLHVWRASGILAPAL